MPGLSAGKQFAGVDAGQAGIHARPTGAHLQNPLLISFNGSSPGETHHAESRKGGWEHPT